MMMTWSRPVFVSFHTAFKLPVGLIRLKELTMQLGFSTFDLRCQNGGMLSLFVASTCVCFRFRLSRRRRKAVLDWDRSVRDAASAETKIRWLQVMASSSRPFTVFLLWPNGAASLLRVNIRYQWWLKHWRTLSFATCEASYISILLIFPKRVSRHVMWHPCRGKGVCDAMDKLSPLTPVSCTFCCVVNTNPV